ncbi:MAG TPA: outer membrane beta-barrel protein [Vicinamibacterales bacterium]|jgi:hypothetical protein|nr:outer membrane beta-barrel protein [Vicinamibacterales bacterium]
MKLVALAVGLSLLAAAPLFAADAPKFELGGAYSVMQETSRSESFRSGWAISAIGNVNNWVGVAVEVGGNYRTCTDCQRGPFSTQRLQGTNVPMRIHTYLAGPRVASHASPVVAPFGQFLVGGAHLSGGLEWDGALNTGTVYQPGGGVDVRVAPGAAIRFQGDYRVIRTSGRNNKQSRFLAGVVLSGGTR